MKALFLLTLLAGGSTAILFNVPIHWEQPREYYKPPQVYGQLDEEHGWKTTLVYGEPLCDESESQRGPQEFSTFFPQGNRMETIDLWELPAYSGQLDEPIFKQSFPQGMADGNYLTPLTRGCASHLENESNELRGWLEEDLGYDLFPYLEDPYCESEPPWY